MGTAASRRDDALTADPLAWARSGSRVVETLDRVGAKVLAPVVSRDVHQRFRALLHTGSQVHCPVCGSSFREFANRWNSRSVVCWTCGSHERHRALRLVLNDLRRDLLDEATRLLHFAPEGWLQRDLAARPGLRYDTGDLDPSRADMVLDLCALDLPDDSYDAVLCLHVLEHVADDRRAMRELRRVLRPGGWAIVMVPMDHGRDETDEDPSVVDPQERKRRFWQEDHVRLYGRDLLDRLRDAGFAVETIRVWDIVGDDEAERLCLNWGDEVYVCR